MPYLPLTPEGLDVLVSRTFREALSSSFEIRTPEDWFFLAYLLFGTFRDDDNGAAVVDRVSVANLFGVEPKLITQGLFRSNFLIAEFATRTGLQLHLTNSNSIVGKARTCRIVLNEHLQSLFEQCQIGQIEMVYFISGKSFSEREEQRRRILRADARANFPLSSLRPNFAVGTALNRQPPKSFAPFVKRLTQACEYVSTTMSGDKRTGQLRILSTLSTFFPPTYKQVRNSERLFTVGDSAAYLSSDVRDILFSGTWSADLSNAHLVIAARLWGLDDLLNLIEEKGSIWPYLMCELQLPIEKKPELKKVIYATVYGKPVPQLKGQITRELGREFTERYMLLPMTATLLEGREQHMDGIRSNGGITDAYGKFHALTDTGEKGESAVRTILSREVGSYEFKVMSAAAEIIRGSNGQVWIPLWLHDGIYVKFRDAARVENWKLKITEAVALESSKYGMPLKLVWELS
ncbi:hypothetical protein FNU79_00535 [Deinococcus detaillensis]|uniref:Uncharacterized protein n=1 Tax=Deinococcus detaillensis TaxID=2592048 RepID=A0A553V6C1_9DEIO|nr:hypothetical protein [Deinococcus detaillensis]TSA87781.1 hypothetical protein FNU79_00535 [Deinococcus detaillensis]